MTSQWQGQANKDKPTKEHAMTDEKKTTNEAKIDSDDDVECLGSTSDQVFGSVPTNKDKPTKEQANERTSHDG